MSLSSTSTIKTQLTTGLGSKANSYFTALKLFVTGQHSRTEFDETIRHLLSTPTLVQLHNALIISLFDATTTLKRPPLPITPPPPTAPKPPPRKRRRTLLPYQGPSVPDSARTLHSTRLKRWTLGVGKRERDRLRTLQTISPPIDQPHPRREMDEIASERGVVLLPERGDPPGSRLAVHLHAATRAPTIQHIADRMNLICAQNNLSAPGRNVPALMNLACEAKLKQLITHALTLTSTSHAISSIVPSSQQSPPLLSASSFQTLFTVAPADLPNRSAAATQLALGDVEEADDDRDVMLLKDREVHDQRWQIVALLGERSTVKDALRSVRK